MKDSLGDRMKQNYENVSRNFLVKRMPVIIRVDGRAFHTFTKNCVKPFDMDIVRAMLNSARDVAIDMQGFKLAYVQSDEVSFLLTDYDNLHTEGWFNYNLNKMVSNAASLMTYEFNRQWQKENDVTQKSQRAIFDARAFNIPREEVSNYFLWRAKDWERNSISMYARAFFSHKELHRAGRADIHEMLHSIGKNWTTDLDDIKKNGTFIVNTDKCHHIIKHNIQPTFEQINNLVEPLVYTEKEEN